MVGKSSSVNPNSKGGHRDAIATGEGISTTRKYPLLLSVLLQHNVRVAIAERERKQSKQRGRQGKTDSAV
ncbi:hypothetical protein AND_009979 [Anopheles darlingi]|uniref:Uncharacterized protein n=1 Tax=Anopheles darlingi TaxID=43151 RepID=W5J2H2_ANODA|nr:hypothetical protein AND_009979 [Anopheles darlingi]